MAKKDISDTPILPERVSVVSREITTEMKESFIDYAMSVITDRALPDVRDGLKPVHRRILYTLHELGLTAGAKTRKSAKIIGDVTGNYHPHGTQAAYGSLVVMAQDFSMRYPLVIGQGNFGCFTKDTQVELTDGRKLSFGELVEEYLEGKKNYTYTVDKNGQIQIAQIQKPRLTIKDAQIMKVILDSGEEIRCTLNHKFMVRSGEYVEAQNLKAGGSLISLNKENQSQISQDAFNNHKVAGVEFLNDREDVYDLTVDGTHNFALAAGVFVHNSIDGDGAAADRYTEAKMSRISSEMLADIDKETVDWLPNYEGTRMEPRVLPSRVPALLLNGTLGIAVGMATSIPPHNLGEVMDAVSHIVDNPDATTEDLMQFIKGPDFPLGGIAFNAKDIAHAYSTGRGGVVVRGNAEIVETKSGQYQIVITSIPFRVNKAEMIVKIADLIREKKLEGIKDMRDESAKDIRVVIELKGTAHPQTVLNYLYKHTQLEDPFHYNMVALVKGVPETLSLKAILEEFVGHRKEIIRRRTEYDLKKALEREHILLGLKKALDHIDAIIKLIRGSKDTPEAHKKLMAEFKFSAIQATAILEMRLARLAGLERKKIEDELKSVQELIEALKAILSSAKRILGIIKDECKEIKEKYGDERRTKIIKGGVQVLSVEDLIPDEENALVLTAGGYIKRTSPDEFRKQKRGGVGVVDLDTKEEDFVTTLLIASTHSDLLFFTDKGKVYQTKMYDIPEGRRATRGKSIVNFLPLSEGEKITSILPMPKAVKGAGDTAVMMVTKQGVAKKVAGESFKDVRISGIIAIKLDPGDALISASFVHAKDTVIVVTEKGQSIHFKEADIREMGRTAMGVRGVKLGKGDSVISAEAVLNAWDNATLMVISEHGYGKRTDIDEYKIQNRGGSGIKTANVTAKTGKLISAKVFESDEAEVVAISKKSQVIRVDAKEIPVLGRQTQGVRVMKLRDGDSIASLICL